MGISRASKNLARNLVRAGRDVLDNVTQPRKARNLDADIAAVRLNRQTKNVQVDAADAAGGNRLAQDIIMSRGRVRQLNAAVQKRKKSR